MTEPKIPELPEGQYIIPYDEKRKGGSDTLNMLANMANFTNMAKHLRDDNIKTYKKFFETLYARYKVLLFRWLKQNWDSLNQEKQDFAKPYYQTGRMIL